MSGFRNFGRDIARYFGISTGTGQAIKHDQHKESFIGNALRVTVGLGIVLLLARVFELTNYLAILALAILIGAASGLIHRLARRHRERVRGA